MSLRKVHCLSKPRLFAPFPALTARIFGRLAKADVARCRGKKPYRFARPIAHADRARSGGDFLFGIGIADTGRVVIADVIGSERMSSGWMTGIVSTGLLIHRRDWPASWRMNWGPKAILSRYTGH